MSLGKLQKCIPVMLAQGYFASLIAALGQQNALHCINAMRDYLTTVEFTRAQALCMVYLQGEPAHAYAPMPHRYLAALHQAIAATYGPQTTQLLTAQIGQMWWIRGDYRYQAAYDVWQIIEPDTAQSLRYHVVQPVIAALQIQYPYAMEFNLRRLPVDKYLLALSMAFARFANDFDMLIPRIAIHDIDYHITVNGCPFCGQQYEDCHIWHGIVGAMVAWLKGEMRINEAHPTADNAMLDVIDARSTGHHIVLSLYHLS